MTNIEVCLYLDEPYAQLHQSLNVFKGCLVKHGANVVQITKIPLQKPVFHFSVSVF